MKTYKHLYERLLSDEVIELAIKNANRGKRKNKKKRQQLQELKTADNRIETVRRWILNYKNDYHQPVKIYDGIRRKERQIIVPSIRELVVQHAVVIALQPMFCKGMYEHSYAALPNRGAHLGKKYMQKWLKDYKNTKYCAKIDIKKYFESIPRERMIEKLRKKIKDEKMLSLLEKILDVSGTGLPLGFYTSQWLSNWYLQDLDHYIKETLKVPYMMRYMDDIVMLSGNKRKLHRAVEDIRDFLSKEGLTIKDNWQIFRMVYDEEPKRGRDIDFMGFRFFRLRVTLRKSILLKATRKAHRMSREKPSIHSIRQMLSYLGWICHTDTYDLYKERIKPLVNIQNCKRRISRYDRRNHYDLLQERIYSQTTGSGENTYLRLCA